MLPLHHLVATHSEHFIAYDILDGWLDLYEPHRLFAQTAKRNAASQKSSSCNCRSH